MFRSDHDREIFRLAVPALGALAAEPLYVLADTAIIGHLGTPELPAHLGLGAPLFMLATAAQGYLRGVSDLRTPLIILLVANGVNVVLDIVFIYGFGWGRAGSAAGTVIAQLGMGAAFVWIVLRAEPMAAPRLAAMRPLMRVGSEVAVRTSALLVSFLVASAVLARVGAPSLGAHQIAFQLFVFLALVLDALAIAGQVMVGRMLGGGDAAGTRRAPARRPGG